MADARLREFERAAAGGEPAARVAFLRARVRAGDLAHDRLELAAHLGDEAAGAATKDGPCRECDDACWVPSNTAKPDPRTGGVTYVQRCPSCCPNFAEWLDGFKRWEGSGNFVLVASARAVLVEDKKGHDQTCWWGWLSHRPLHPNDIPGTEPPCSKPRPPIGGRRAELAIRAADELLRCPCTEHLLAYEKATTHDDSKRPLAPWIPDLRATVPWPVDRAAAFSAASDHPGGRAAIREAVRDELVPWALGGEVRRG